MVMNVTAGRVSADSTKVRRLSGQAPIKSCARPARSDPGVDGQIHKKTAANSVRVVSGLFAVEGVVGGASVRG